MGSTIHVGDALEILKTLDADSLDAIVTDPPAGISFMDKEWDDFRRARNPADAGRDNAFGRASRTGPEYGRGPRKNFIDWLTSVMVEALRVLKPGAHALVWAIPRTSHWTATAIEDAGFEVRDVITHHFGSGFPKSLDVDKAISPDGKHVSVVDHGMSVFGHEGDGTALKPASEHWILARKPMIGTVAANVLEYGTGGLDIDGCRVGPGHQNGRGRDGEDSSERRYSERGNVDIAATPGPRGGDPLGRWPPNLLLTHSAVCGDAECAPCCPVREIGAQSGNVGGCAPASGPTLRDGSTSVARGKYNGLQGDPAFHADTGTAARFFPTFRYEAKPSTAEREQGLAHKPKQAAGELTGGRKEGSAGLNNPRAGAGRTSKGRANTHPTVKSIALMQWLCRLITPPSGRVLDPFCGSGTTCIAALREGFSFTGIELDPEYAEIAQLRIVGDAPLFNKIQQP